VGQEKGFGVKHFPKRANFRGFLRKPRKGAKGRKGPTREEPLGSSHFFFSPFKMGFPWNIRRNPLFKFVRK